MMADNDPFAEYKKPKTTKVADDDPFAEYKKPPSAVAKPPAAPKAPAAAAAAAAAPKPPAPKRPAKPVPKPQYTWGDAGYDAIVNTKQGVADAIAGVGNLTYDSYTDFPGTVRKMGKAGAGIAGALIPKAVTMGLATSPMAKALPKSDQNTLKNMSPPVADLVGQYYAGYLDPEELKQRVGKHPIATAADIASVAMLPGISQAGRAVGTAVAARVPKAVTRAAQAARYVAVPTHAVNDAAGFVAKKVVPSVGNRLIDSLNPTAAMTSRNLEGRGQAVYNALKNPKRHVPGSNPTTAQAASDADAPRFVAVAKAAEARNPGPQWDTLKDQHQARVDYLRTIADPDIEFRNPSAPANPTSVLNFSNNQAPVPNPTLDEHLSNLRLKRDADKATGYGYTDPAVIQTNQGIYDVLDLELNRSVLPRAQTMANSEPRPFQANFTPAQPAQVIPDPFGQNLPPTIIPAVPAKYPMWTGKDADTVKKAFDDLITKTRTDNAGGNGPAAVAIMRNNREKYLNLIHQLLPEYTATRAEYAANSQNIDRAALVKYLEERLQSPTMGEATIKPRADVYSNAIREAPGASSTVNKATGEKYFNNLSDRFDPAQMKVTQNIQDDMARAQIADAQGAAGGHFSSEIDSIMSEALGFNPNRGTVVDSVARAAMSPLNSYLGGRAVKNLSTTPGAAQMVKDAIALERMKRRSGQAWGLAQATNNFINPVAIANRYPTLYNAMNTPQQQGQPQQ